MIKVPHERVIDALEYLLLYGEYDHTRRYMLKDFKESYGTYGYMAQVVPFADELLDGMEVGRALLFKLTFAA